MTYILSFIVAFGVAAILGQILIPVLRRLKAGQAIREDGPTWHMSKQGTPTIGPGGGSVRSETLSGGAGPGPALRLCVRRGAPGAGGP